MMSTRVHSATETSERLQTQRGREKPAGGAGSQGVPSLRSLVPSLPSPLLPHHLNWQPVMAGESQREGDLVGGGGTRADLRPLHGHQACGAGPQRLSLGLFPPRFTLSKMACSTLVSKLRSWFSLA